MAQNDFEQAVLQNGAVDSSTEMFSSFQAAQVKPYSAKVDSQGRKKVAWNYEFKHEVFVIHRPWETCNRCFSAKESGLFDEITTDIVCPHTRLKEYIFARNQVARGEAVAVSISEETLKNGTVQVSYAWAVPLRKNNESKIGPTRY